MAFALIALALVLCAASSHFVLTSLGADLEPRSTAPVLEGPVPKAAIIVPCRGDGQGRLATRLRAVLAQDYPAAEFVLVTDSADDPAYAVFMALRAAHPDRAIRCVVAPSATTSSQKNANLLAALDACSDDVAFFVFLDSDGIASSGLVGALCAALRRTPEAPAATGFRWYGGDGKSVPSKLRMAWNAGGFSFLLNPSTRFVWGGAMAFRREALGELRVRWSRSLSDDLGLSAWLKEQPAPPVFSPAAIMWSEEDDSWSSVLRWTTRQTYLTRIYDPTFYWTGFITHALGWLLFSAGLALGGPAGVASSAWLVHLPLAYAARLGALSAMMARSGWTLSAASRATLVCFMPLVSLTLVINSIAALAMRSYLWAGIRYRVDGPFRVRAETR